MNAQMNEIQTTKWFSFRKTFILALLIFRSGVDEMDLGSQRGTGGRKDVALTFPDSFSLNLPVSRPSWAEP